MAGGICRTYGGQLPCLETASVGNRFSLATQSANGINLYESYLDMKKSGDPRPFIYPDAAGEWNSDKLEMQ